ncbi:hypothetical protein IKG48_01665 [Candidatus Saccharibacteria bacterium]|nr:hypothetical protein [Candidatus Saccharibacteria bacterium]
MENNKSGFTILELALAMAFISFLMLAIGFAIVQITNIYQKGVTIKVVNNNGRELVDEFSRTILASKYDKVENDKKGDFEYTYTETRGKVEVAGEEKEVPLHGAFCVGNYSYLWNTGYALNLDDYNEGHITLNIDNNEEQYASGKAYLILGEDTDTTKPVTKINYRLARVADTGREACKTHSEEENNSPKYVITKATENEYVELLSPSESDLALYDFTVFEPAYHSGTGHALYSASFILGTLGGGIDITIPGNFCTDKPENLKTDFNYCSINKFNFAARATGGLAI